MTTAETVLGHGLPFEALTRWSEPAFGPGAACRVEVRPLAPSHYAGDVRIGFIRNGKARLNIGRYGLEVGGEGDRAMPDSLDELRSALTLFARNGVNALVIDGGDGTVRDVLSIAARCFDRFPRIAVVPSGKTNALAYDLGIPSGWTEEDAVAALRAGRYVERSLIEVHRPDARFAELQGFIFGAGAFVAATGLAQKTHRLGAFNGLAVGLSVAGGVAQSLIGGEANRWRQGTPMRLSLPDGRSSDDNKYLLLASTLERMPLGLKPFGTPRPGLKLLAIDAQPRRLAAALPALLGGRDLPVNSSYHRIDTGAVTLAIKGDFILDGECFPGGAMTLRRGAPIGFAVP